MFEQVIGQQYAKDFLRAQLEQQRIPHAQLWSAQAGSGLLAMSVAYAQFLQCENRDNGNACGRCSHCLKAKSFIHPDIHFSFPTVGSKATSAKFMNEWRAQLKESPYFSAYDWLQRMDAGNRQGNITRAECDDIIHQMNLKAFEGKYKIWIIWLPEYLGAEGNRLLKLIEEPPANTVFIFLTMRIQDILTTIVSRCQLLQFQALSDQDIAEALTTRYDLPEARSAEIAALAEGDFTEALKLRQEQSKPHSQLFIQWMRLCYALQPAALSEWIEVQSRSMGREDHKQFFRYALLAMRKLMMQKASKEKEGSDTLSKMATVIPMTSLPSIVEIINDSINHIERNAHYKILMMNASIRINKLMKAK